LLVTEGQIEAECAAGNKTLLNRGDLLIMNESSVSHAAFFLEGSAHVRDDDLLTSAQNNAPAIISSALHGAIRPHQSHWHARPFAHNPARAMAVAHLNERVYESGNIGPLVGR
jgi:hypothetical protein